MQRLPSRIAAVMVAALVLFVVTLASSILLMTKGLDDQALRQSMSQVRNVQADLLAKTRMITMDYTKWDAAVTAMEAGDVTWLYENIGSTAEIGRAVQVVVVWDGALEHDLGWTSHGGPTPRSGSVATSSLEMIEDRLAAMSLGDGDGVEFFEWHDGSIFAFGAARFEPVNERARWEGRDAGHGYLVMGLRLDQTLVDTLAGSLGLDDVQIVPEPPVEEPHVTLSGVEGQPVAYMTWDRPQPGSTMLRVMTPWLAVVTALLSGLAALSVKLLRRNAVHLVDAEHQASNAAHTDALTGLPNRAAFNVALACPARGGKRAILFLDVNGFKRINDSLGHAAGDQVITQIAQRLGRLLDSGGLLARISGDEFVFLVLGPDAADQVENLARMVTTSFAAPFHVLGRQLQIQAAIGYATQTCDELSGDDLVRQADLAMYEAKRNARRGPVAFCALLDEESNDASLIERRLRQAMIANDGLGIAYQPIVTPAGQFVRAEALARWTAQDLGAIAPSRFIRVAEQAGLIHDLGRLLLQQVCDDLAAHPGLHISLNVSPLQLVTPDFIPDVLGELARRSVDPGRIEIELTESVLVDDVDVALGQLQSLQDAGFTVALDDFGTGYSSVAYLEQLSFNTLKIDRSFTAELRSSAKRYALIRAMIQMAHGLDLCVVAEGVETAEDLRLLSDLGCDLIQGYHLDRPLTIDELSSRWLGRPCARAAA